MKTPEEKYTNDPEYRRLVDSLEQLVEMGRFTPSELREACVYAAIRYEMRRVPKIQYDPRADEAIVVLDKFARKKK